MVKKIYLLFIILSVLNSACSKKPVSPKVTGLTTNTLDLIKDSVYLYAAEDYLWAGSLPTYTKFKPRSFSASTDIVALQNELDSLSQYAINPATGKPYEYSTRNPGSAKYSFIDDGSVGAALDGIKGDFGFNIEYNLENDLRVIYVYPGSPAALAGLKRGYRITAINNNTNISYDAKGYGTGTSTNLNFVSNAIYKSSNISLKIIKPDSSSFTVALNTAAYTVNPVLKDTTFNLGNGHILGYLVFNSFTSQSNAGSVIAAVFADFAAKNVTDLAIDLRYNGGGYVSTAEYLDNLIVPSGKNNSLMYNTYYSANIVAGNDPLLSNQWRRDPSTGRDVNYAQYNYSVAANAKYFQKLGSLNAARVFFIVTGSTASASELTINNLYPEMDVQLVGRTTYGKPVGFFDIDINKYVLYTPEFSVKNSAGIGDYYSGFTPGTTTYPGINDYDDPTKEFGDPAEVLLSHVLHYLKTGTYAVTPNSNPTVNLNRRILFMKETDQNPLGGKTDYFKGMIFKRK